MEFSEDIFDGINPNVLVEIAEVLEKYFFLEPLELIRSLWEDGFFEPSFLAEFNSRVISVSDSALREVLQRTPGIDMVVIDQSAFKLPVLLEKGIPHVDIYPHNPLWLYPEEFPPWMGFSENTPNVSSTDYKKALKRVFQALYGSINSFYVFPGEERSTIEDNLRFHMKPKYLGFYHYPEDLDYHNLKPIIDNYERIDSLIIDLDNGNSFTIPEKLQIKLGKLIYFSMGTIVSGCQDLMNNLLKILSSSPNRFIVTLGGKQMPNYNTDEYENIWCCDFVDQLAVLKQVDLIIFHGGNNSMMEALFFGVPMIAIPQYLEQIDNAQRIEDKRIGRRMFLWEFDAKKLLNMIEDVLEDEEVRKNVTRVSSNMRQSKSVDRAIDLIEGNDILNICFSHFIFLLFSRFIPQAVHTRKEFHLVFSLIPLWKLWAICWPDVIIAHVERVSKFIHSD